MTEKAWFLALTVSAQSLVYDVSFEEAATVFADPAALTFPDPDDSEEELREITIGHTIKEKLNFRLAL